MDSVNKEYVHKIQIYKLYLYFYLWTEKEFLKSKKIKLLFDRLSTHKSNSGVCFIIVIIKGNGYGYSSSNLGCLYLIQS